MQNQAYRLQTGSPKQKKKLIISTDIYKVK